MLRFFVAARIKELVSRTPRPVSPAPEVILSVFSMRLWEAYRGQNDLINDHRAAYSEPI